MYSSIFFRLLPLTIQLETINLWKFNVYAVLADEKRRTPIDETKRIMLSMNPSYMLSFTLITSLLHCLFEFLAVKNGTRLLFECIKYRLIFFFN